MTAASVTVLPAPPCPSWCTENHQAEGGWDRRGPDTDKFCRYRPPVDVHDVVVTTERFASVVDGRIEVEPVQIRVEVADVLAPAEVATLADVLRRAAELARRTDRSACQVYGVGMTEAGR